MELPAHQMSMTVLMTPDKANFSGNVHGGNILKLLDQVAVITSGFLNSGGISRSGKS